MPGTKPGKRSIQWIALYAGITGLPFILNHGPLQAVAQSGATAPTTIKKPVSAPAQAIPKRNGEVVAIEPEEAGPDFKLQGEYEGSFTAADGTTQQLGAQVVAIGAGAFRAYLLLGGLPGAGWDGTSKFVVQGRTQGNETTLESLDGKGYKVTVNGEILNGQTAKGEKFELKKVTRESPTLGAQPTAGALVLFNGTNMKEWRQGRMDGRKLLSAMLNPAVRTFGEGPVTKRNFKDFFVHLEFRLPFKPYGRGQNRCNSGVCPQERYEIQILDSFGFGLGIKTGEGDVCGDIMNKSAAAVNMCLPPLSWQTYDIDFHAARFDKAGKKTQNARVTIKLNGVVIQDNQEINGATRYMKPEGPQLAPLMLQDHGNLVFFRNIWLVEK